MWWIRRLTCWLGGHHDLCLAAAYGEILPSGRSKELHYCARCGRGVWTSPPSAGRSPPRWADTGESMKCTSLLKGGAWAFVASGVLFTASAAQAQVEALERNPLEPEGVGADIELEARNQSSGGPGIGRTVVGPARRADENPAETMLRSIEGTNYGHRTGRAMRGDAAPAAPRSAALPRKPPPRPAVAVESARRGSYQSAHYVPRRYYRWRAPRRAPTVRTWRSW